MERLPNPPFHDFSNLLDRSDDLVWRSDRFNIESRQLAKYLTDLITDSDKLIQHCRRICSRSQTDQVDPHCPE